MASTRATFEEWMARVDALLLKRYGFTHDDLVDCCYMDWYEDGLTPAQAVRLVRDEQGF